VKMKKKTLRGTRFTWTVALAKEAALYGAGAVAELDCAAGRGKCPA